MNRVIIVLFLLMLVSSPSFAQSKNSKKDFNTYYVTKAEEEVAKHNFNNALELVEMELKSNPTNHRAHYIFSVCQINLHNISAALSSINKSLEYLNKKDDSFRYAEYLAWRGEVYSVLGDTVRALNDLSKSIDISPNVFAYEYRVNVYLAQKKYDLATSDANGLIEYDPANATNYAILAKCYACQGNYDEAIKNANFAIKLNAQNDVFYISRCSYYEQKKDYTKAAKDIISAIVSGNSVTYDKYQVVSNAAVNYLPQLEKELKRAIFLAKHEGARVFQYYLAEAYRVANMDEKAIPLFSAMLEDDQNTNIMARMAACYQHIGQYDEALSILEKALSIEEGQESNESVVQWFTSLKIAILDDAGRSQEAIDILSDIIDNKVPDATTYYRRAWIRQYQGDYQGAIDDFSQAISMDPENQIHSMLTRGNLRRITGDEAGANEDFEFIVDLRNDDGEFISASMFAYHYLGNDQKAVEVLNALLAKNPDMGDFYNAACLESLMGNKSMAIAYLDSAFNKGYNEYVHISRDRDLDNIRDSQEFKDLIAHNMSKQQEKRNHKGLMLVKSTVDAESEEKVVEIPFTKDGNMCKVKCQVNGLPLHFIFDTGASDISISSVEASFMFKNDYLSRSDIRGSQNYMTANGEISTGTIVNLREVKLNDVLSLSDIRASVAHNQSAPLLLGQSVLERLGKIEIDNEKKVLRITYTQKNK